MKNIKWIFLVISFAKSFATVSAQDYSDYLNAAKKHIQNGNIEKAESVYNVYKQLAGKIDSNIEDLLLKNKESNISEHKNPDILTIMVGTVELDMMYVKGGTFKGRVPDLGDCQRDLERDSGTEWALSGEKWTLFDLVVKDFYIATTEVTQELWEVVMQESFRDYLSQLSQTHSYLKGYNLEHGIGSQCPVYYVSDEDAKEFIMRLNRITGKNFRLPTTREWIYAEGGGSNSIGFRYSGSNSISRVAWYSGNSEGNVHPVKTKLPNELGIYDLSGNVSEWTQCPYWGVTIYGSSYNCSEKGCLLQNNWRAKGAFSSVGFRLAMDYPNN